MLLFGSFLTSGVILSYVQCSEREDGVTVVMEKSTRICSKRCKAHRLKST